MSQRNITLRTGVPSTVLFATGLFLAPSVTADAAEPLASTAFTSAAAGKLATTLPSASPPPIIMRLESPGASTASGQVDKQQGQKTGLSISGLRRTIAGEENLGRLAAVSPGKSSSGRSGLLDRIQPSATSPSDLAPDTAGNSAKVSQDGVVYEQDEESKQIAQAARSADTGTAGGLDLAPVKLPERTTALSNFDSYRTSALYKLPGRVFLNASCENSLRLETNVFQTSSRNRADMVYRVLPNVTLGYAVTPTTRVAFNYFYFRDQYMRNENALSRNIHSIGFRADQDIPLTARTSLTASFMARELLLSRTSSLSDLLPSLVLVHRVGNRGVVYASALTQIRFQKVLKTFQEVDQFYGVGGVYRTPRWTLLADHTFISNIGRRSLRGGPDNGVIVLTYEAAYKVHPALPVALFCRAEPIFNIGANQAIGFAGFNFRVFGGIRVEVSKPPIFPVKLPK